MSNPADDEPRPRRRWVRWLAYGGLALVVLWAAGLIYLYNWKAARTDLPSDSHDYQGVRQAFLNEVNADRLDAAYQLTTEEFRNRVSLEVFEQRVRRYRAFQARPDVRGVAGESSGPTGGDGSAVNEMVIAHTLEDPAGNQLTYTTRIRFQDSLFHLTPPPPQIDDFTIEELIPQNR
jgi:hypothetical protein